MTHPGLLARWRLAVLGDLGGRPAPTRLEQLEKRLDELTGAWPRNAEIAGLLAEVGAAREQAGRIDDAIEAYREASGIHARMHAEPWQLTRMLERIEALRPSPAGPYRRDTPPVLLVHHGGRWQRFEQSAILLGRSAPGRTDVHLPSSLVGRHHALILLVDGRHVLRDLASTNGTLLVRRAGVALPAPVPLTDHLIADGDEVRLGEFVVRFALHDSDGSTGFAGAPR